VQETGLQSFLDVCERLRASIEAVPVDYQEMRIGVTISIGVAVRKDAEVFEKVLHNADLALYQAKGTGRNRICVSGQRDIRQSVA
jgi:diguanylate cyclase (GGDEF)-like protein